MTRARDYLRRADTLITDDDQRRAIWYNQSAWLELIEKDMKSAEKLVDQLDTLLKKNMNATWSTPLVESARDIRQEINSLRS